jgi:hypothetical protein
LPQSLGMSPNKQSKQNISRPFRAHRGLGMFLGLKPQVAFADYGAPDSHRFARVKIPRPRRRPCGVGLNPIVPSGQVFDKIKTHIKDYAAHLSTFSTPHLSTRLDSRTRTKCHASIIPFQEIVCHREQYFCPFTEGTQCLSGFFSELLGNPPGSFQTDHGRECGLFGSGIFSGAFSQLLGGLSNVEDVVNHLKCETE